MKTPKAIDHHCIPPIPQEARPPATRKRLPTPLEQAQMSETLQFN